MFFSKTTFVFLAGALAIGCTAPAEDETPTVSASTGEIDPKSAPVCDYGGGQSLLPGPTVVGEHISGCCSFSYYGHGAGSYSCPTSKSQYLGCASGGSVVSYSLYEIGGQSNTRNLPSGASTCNNYN